MPPRVFTVREREELCIKMLEAGFDLIKEQGMTHASVEKITGAVGLGKSTFYNFFRSKEQFVTEIIEYQRDLSKQYFDQILNGREKMSAAEGGEYLKFIIFNQNSIYQYLTDKDMGKLKAISPIQNINPDDSVYDRRETNIMRSLLGHMDGVRSDVNLHVAANLIKIIGLSKINRDSFHTDVLDQTLQYVYDILLSLIFKEDA